MTKVVAGLAQAGVFALFATLCACGGGSSNSAPMQTPPPPPPPPPPTTDPEYLASAPSPFVAGCDAPAGPGVLYANAEVEPFLVAQRASPHTLHAVWQQDRWSTGGARGLVGARSTDGGHSWTRAPVPFTRCGGGSADNGYERASNPWLAIGADGRVHRLALAFDGFALQAGSVSAVLVDRSLDDGATWSAPATLIRDDDGSFNDKGSIVADAADPAHVYALWDRLDPAGFGPTWFARSRDGGASWEPARAIYDPGIGNQTIDNIALVLPNGTLVDVFTELDGVDGNAPTGFVAAIRSDDDGLTWSAPIRIADQRSVGTRTPGSGAPVRDSAFVPAATTAPGGRVVVTWQDSRFSNGARDGVAFARSDDGGLTWSAPVRINGDATVAAFSPVVHVRDDGAIGIVYYDFRTDGSGTATVPTTVWLARSSDGTNWTETQLTPTFDLALAPRVSSPGAGGYFLGDYQGLASVDTTFVAALAKTNATASNPTDIFAIPAVSASAALSSIAAQARGGVDASAERSLAADERERVAQNLVQTMESRLPGWHARMQATRRR